MANPEVDESDLDEYFDALAFHEEDTLHAEVARDEEVALHEEVALLEKAIHRISEEVTAALDTSKQAEGSDREDTVKPLGAMSDQQIRELLKQGCEELHRRNAFFPEEVTYSPREPRCFLQLPPEIRDQIYQLAEPSFMATVKRKIPTKNSPKLYHLRMGYDNDAGMPYIFLRFAGPVEIPALAGTCRQIFNDLVRSAHAQHPYSLKIDCTHIAPHIKVAEFWHVFQLLWISRTVHQLKIELRCSMQQWAQIEGGLGTILSRISRNIQQQPTVTIRLFIDYPSEEELAFRATLPSFYSENDIMLSKMTWFKSFVKVMDQSFMTLKDFSCVHRIEFMHLCEPIKIATTKLHQQFHVQYIQVLSRHASTGEWTDLEGERVFYDGLRNAIAQADFHISDL